MAQYLREDQLEPLLRRRKVNVEKWEELKKFFYFKQGQRRRIFGNDEKRWGETAIYMTAFYFGLIFFFACMLGFFCLALDEIRPMYIGSDGAPTNHLPGMGYRPQPDFDTTLIRFIQGKPETYKPYTDHLQVFLEQYENEAQVGENIIDCDNGRDDNDWQLDKVCMFNVDKLGGMCTWQKDFGYDEGQPCILLKINKLWDWWPELFDYDELPKDHGNLLDRWDKDFLPVRCTGRYDADHENIGNVTYYPPQGFPRFFFPFMNQEGYRSPLLMVRFENPVNGIVINIQCKIYVRNVVTNIQESVGAVTFALLVD